MAVFVWMKNVRLAYKIESQPNILPKKIYG